MDLKIIRDPIYDYIAIEMPKNKWLLDLLDTPEVQRLRHIHQLGVCQLVYPGACHTRFGHALGVLHLMQQAVDHLRQLGRAFADGEEDALLAAAILHDVGHGPFSHLLEDKLGKPHEDWSCLIINHAGVRKILRTRGIVDRVLSLVRRDDWPRPLWQKCLISSQLDVDRMDYILRDSYFTGAGYGRFDYYRLIHTLGIEAGKPLPGQSRPDEFFVWPEKTKYAIEEYLFARFYMYQSVYFHPCTRGYEKLLAAIWDRAAILLAGRKSFPVSEVLKPFLKGRSVTIDQYLRLGECHLLSQFEEWKGCRDKVLSDLCGRFLMRRGFKSIQVTERLEGLSGHDKLEEVIDFLRCKKGIWSEAPRSYILEDRGGAQPYKPYRWGEKEEQQTPILLKGLQEVSEVLPRLKTVIEADGFSRYYCPQELKRDVERILKS